MTISILRLVFACLLASQLSGCLSAYYLLTAPFEHIKRSKPDLYYSFAITIKPGDTQRTFSGSILCKHKIGFSAANGWWDAYHTDVTDIAFSDPEQGISWQLHGISCPDFRPAISGIFRKGQDGNIQVLSWLENDTETFSNEWEFSEHPKHPVFTSPTRIFENNQYPATQYVYWVMKLNEVPEALSKISDVSVVSFNGRPECIEATSRVAAGNIRSLFSPKNGEYMRRGFLEYSSQESAWILSAPRSGNRFVDVSRKNFSGKYSTGKNCPKVSYKGMHLLSDRGGEAVYDPKERLLIMVEGNHPSYVQRNLYIDSIHDCDPNIPTEALESLDKYPDYYEVLRSWSEVKAGRSGNQYTVSRQSVLMKVDGEKKCIEWPREALYGRGW